MLWAFQTRAIGVLGRRREGGDLVDRFMSAFDGHPCDVELLKKWKEREEFREWLLLAIVLAMFCCTRTMKCAVCAKIVRWYLYLRQELLPEPVDRDTYMAYS